MLLLLGCGGETTAGLLPAFDYVAADGTEFEMVRPGEELQPPLLIRTSPGAWELRNGDRFDTATQVGSWTVNDETDIRIEDVLVLPEHFKRGDAVEDTVVLEIGERETWYGVFPQTVTVEISSGALTGEAAFAANVGPIFLTIDGTAWELATYRPDSE